MKIWAWIIGGIGVTAGAWWILKGRTPATATTPEAAYPEGVVPGVTPGYPVAPSADQLPPDPAKQAAPAMGETNAQATQPSAYQAPASSVGYGEPTTSTAPSSGTSNAVGAGTSSGPPASKVTTPLVKLIAPPPPQVFAPIVKAAPIPVAPIPVAPITATPIQVAPITVAPSVVALPGDITRTVQTAPISAKPLVLAFEPLAKPEPVKVAITTYKSPVTSVTNTVVAPIVKPAPIVMAPKAPSVAPIVIKPVSKPLAVVRPTNVRGIYAVGADFTEAEYHAMAAKAELESKRREWAANQMAERANVMNRIGR